MATYNGAYCVYAHINKINGKIYIGQTIYGDTPNMRWKNGYGYKRQEYFYNAIKKYGWDGFEHEIIASNLTEKEANNFEKLLIKELDTMNQNKGYNLSTGGDGISGHKLSEETKKKISKSSKGSLPGENSNAAKSVICLETMIIYPTITIAGEKLNINSSMIGSCCNGKLKTAGGFQWKFYNDEFIQQLKSGWSPILLPPKKKHMGKCRTNKQNN